jgi:hypothetical protein
MNSGVSGSGTDSRGSVVALGMDAGGFHNVRDVILQALWYVMF